MSSSFDTLISCGTSADSCDPKKGCVSGCWTSEDGCKVNGCDQFKKTAPCCSKWGYCGKTETYCSVAQGCVNGCWPSNTNYNSKVTNCLRDGCRDKNFPCCSQWGHCGSTAEYCEKSQGCKSGCWSTNTASSQNLIGRLVHEGFIANTRSATSWLNARNLFFTVVDSLYKFSGMSGQRSVWDNAKNQKSSAESSRDFYWLGDPRTYIDNVMGSVKDKPSQEVLKVLSMSAVRLVATKPQDCSGSEKATFCVFSNPAPSAATLGCTRYNCYFSPGTPCISRSGKIGRCSSPTFFSNNKIKCPALSCVQAGKRYIDAEVIAALRKKRDLAGSYYVDLIRTLINRKRSSTSKLSSSSSSSSSALSTVLKSTRKRIGSDPDLLDLRDIGRRATCSSVSRCEHCGINSDTFTSECSANFNGLDLCCLCAFDFGADTWSM
eukprot:TRINITY_DN1562_c0_g1_i1.p1 TRINITY_DN1562_c0_g1~~TRINITY_DN1562_c0_g1_i1.p1  ORF type:complete len:434 (-),score=70.80 TRINITY_DN1562_c0_g1_i1:600-1901(-)